MAASDGAAIRLRAVEFAWPRGPRVLSIGALEVARGERVMLRGASGSGKSTLLGVIGGVLAPQAGSVEVLGTDLVRLPRAARDRFRGQHFGFIFQQFNLIPYLSVIDNVLLPARLSAARAARVAGEAGAAGDAGAAARALLAALGLGDAALQARAVTALSIGQQQRVAAARALLGRPEIIVADEPTSSLDADAREGFLGLLMQECRAAGSTLLFVSHDASLAGRFDRTLAMDALNAASAAAA